MKIDKKILAKSLISNGLIIGALDYVAVSSTVYLPKLLNAVPEPEKMTAVSDYFLNEWMMNPSNALHSAIQTPEIQLGAMSLFLGLTVKDLWNSRRHKVEKASEYGAFGTSDFIKLKDIESDTKDFSLDLATAGTIIGMINGKPIIHRESSYKNRNVMVFGISGTQKSKSYIIPNILNTDSDSIIVTDPKGELYETTSEAKRKQGYSVHLMSFDLTENETSDKYNSLDYINSDVDAAELGNTLVINANGLPANGDSFWVNSEAGVIATLALYAKYFLPKEQQHLGSVYNILVSNPKALHHMFKDIPDNHIVKRSYDGCIGNKEEKMRAQIMGGASSAIDLWKYDETRNLTYTSDFNLQDIGKEKMIIYVKMPVGKKYSRPLIATFFNQLFEQLYKLAEGNHGVLPNPVRMLLDEFANIGQIPMFEERLSTTRSLGIYVTPVLQSLEQLRNRYGREKASEIMDNCDTHIFLGTNDKDAQKHFSEKLGITTIRIQGESESKNERGESSGESKNYVQRPLMTADEINRLPDNKSIVFMRTKQPMMLDKAFYTKLKPLADLMESKVKLHDYQSATSIPYDIYEPPKFKEAKEKPKSKPKVDPLDEMMDSLMAQMPPDEEQHEPVAVRSKVQTMIDDFDI
ncbi:VirD4-like conjugal transfer protein, CD1115 family [Peribacillus simplex]|uniref:VirD4-like conjugal transfer protein, CD1115 family n=1 Tax=Peribacillus simplex TaxID=1478 RepID=UPI003D042AAE